ncbi:MAG: efflux RND transporter periplasmic adaptor subunit [Candidatus Omnitrophica bacterium]|nr:efflux RND transporter periplasmic adaptor subunit [Candidatus Omnitrophota bacterium]
MNKKRGFFIIIVFTLIVAAFLAARMKGRTRPAEIIEEIRPAVGNIETFVSTTGTVLPKNRLEVKPPVAGRIESIEVKEGEKIKAGSTLAWMSSTERAALLDSARGQGEDALKYWKEVYKAIPLLSPIDGEVIVATTQPGQTVTTTDPVIVLSDRLIVRAQVDETDIGKIKEGQNAFVTRDAYPDTKIKAVVEHIYYESKTVSNVTVYQADLLPEEVPYFFRSGMNASIDFIEKSKEGILTIPKEAVRQEKEESYVLLKQEGSGEPVMTRVILGASDDKNVEIISGIGAADTIIISKEKYALPRASSGGSPFLPGRRR